MELPTEHHFNRSQGVCVHHTRSVFQFYLVKYMLNMNLILCVCEKMRVRNKVSYISFYLFFLLQSLEIWLKKHINV